MDKKINLISQNSKNSINPNLMNLDYLSEYIDLSDEIQYFLYDVDLLHNQNLTTSLSTREIDLISNFYNLTGKSSKKIHKEYENSLLFYNSISLVLLSMLTGGIVGVVIIIYISFKHDNTNNLTIKN